MDDPAVLVPIALALAAIGALAGLAAGLLGIGGGVVMVPALYYFEGVLGVADAYRMHIAVGTSLSVIIVTSAFSVRTHWRHRAVDIPILKPYGPGVLAGVALGTVQAALVSGAVLTAVFASAALMVSLNMLRGARAAVLGTHMPGGLGSGALGLLTGTVSTLAGIGGGAMSVAILTLFSVPIHLAVGTASAVGVLVSVPGAAGFAGIGWGLDGLPPLSLGYVNLAAFAVIAPATAFMAPVGARLAHRLPRRRLARIFAVFLAVAALRMFWDILTS